jgi:hypothetical protein
METQNKEGTKEFGCQKHGGTTGCKNKGAIKLRTQRGRPKLTWDESVKRDLKESNISKDLAMDRSAWRLAINVPEP